MDDGTEPIADDELLYRRIPATTGWYSPTTGLSPQAFSPHKEHDLTGISVSRVKYKSIEEAAKGQGRSYYVAILKAGDLRRKGIRVEPKPQPGDPGHAELPDLNAGNRKSSDTLERMVILASLFVEVRGPFSSEGTQ